jgi:hypothetical protein
MSNNGTHDRMEIPGVDPKMDAWLDRALIAEDPPDELNDRVMVVVRRELDFSASEAPAVAGRISAWQWTLRIAAVIAVAALLGVAYQLFNASDTQNDATEVDSIKLAEDGLQNLLIPADETAFDSQLADEFDAFEEDLDAFAARLEWSSDSFDEALDSLTDEL